MNFKSFYTFFSFKNRIKSKNKNFFIIYSFIIFLSIYTINLKYIINIIINIFLILSEDILRIKKNETKN